MWRMWLVTAVAVLIALGVVVGWAAGLTVNGGTLQVFTFPVELGPVAATVDIDPDTLNPESQGKFVMAYVELPEGYDVADIDLSTVTLEVDGVAGSVPAAPSPTAVGDEDGDGVPDRMVKFNREAVAALIGGWTGEITFRVSGEVSGSPFEGTDTIQLLASQGDAEEAEPAAPQEPPSPLPMRVVEYEVRPGDTLVGIAARFGTTVEALAQLNGLEDPDVILYGLTINVPLARDASGEVVAEAFP
jgi:LysM repeat protein